MSKMNLTPANQATGLNSNVLMILFSQNKNKFGVKQQISKFIDQVVPVINAFYSEEYKELDATVQKAGFLTIKLLDGVEMIIEKSVKNEQKKEKQSKAINNVSAENKEKKKFEIKVVKAKFEEDSFEVYQKYCKNSIIIIVTSKALLISLGKEIHGKEEKDKRSYTRFLCMTPIEFTEETNSNGKKNIYGCYHMKYYVDERLLGVGVVDFFKEGMSSVYFFYDPEYKRLSPGVFGAIKEIEYINQMREEFPEFKVNEPL